jgi:hypothetical protein
MAQELLELATALEKKHPESIDALDIAFKLRILAIREQLKSVD